MKKLFFLTFALISIVFISCKRNSNDSLFTGTVIGIADGCTVNTGTSQNQPYLIKLDNLDNLPAGNALRAHPEYNSTLAVSNLPEEFRVVGKRINFSFREFTENDIPFLCNANVMYYKAILLQVTSTQ